MRVLIEHSDCGELITHETSAFPHRCEINLHTTGGGHMGTFGSLKKGSPQPALTGMFTLLPGVLMSISVKDKKWKKWDEHTVRAMEMCLLEEFSLGLETVKLERITSIPGKKCKNDFVWLLSIFDGNFAPIDLDLQI